MPHADSGTVSVHILGVDPGLYTTGWALFVLDGDRIGTLTGVIKPSSQATTPQRLRTILTELRALIEKHSPTVVAVERPFVKENVRAALALGHAQGAAFMAAALHDLPVHEYAPREVKQAIAGDGHATKEAVAAALAMELALDGDQPALLDESDALAIAYCHYLLGRQPTGEAAP